MKPTQQLTPANIRTLTAKAFVLEAITDKPGCTTRFHDLPGKPLQDFILAGINVSEHFGIFAEHYLEDPKTPIFSQNVAALKASNLHKSTKTVNFGLLEVLFPTVAARLSDNSPETVIDTLIKLIHTTTADDARTLLETRSIAWASSTSSLKTGFDIDKYRMHRSVWELYEAFYHDFSAETSSYQWVAEYKAGLPVMRSFFSAYMSAGEVLAATTTVFQKERSEHPDIAIGIVADMCAAAIFLWLSFNESSVY